MLNARVTCVMSFTDFYNCHPMAPMWMLCSIQFDVHFRRYKLYEDSGCHRQICPNLHVFAMELLLFRFETMSDRAFLVLTASYVRLFVPLSVITYCRILTVPNRLARWSVLVLNTFVQVCVLAQTSSRG